jgi:hypothetical protein
MRFLFLSPAFAYALLAGVALVIVLLHLLRPPPPRVSVPSLLLWSRVIRERKRPPARWLVSLLLALAAGLSLALAITRPEIDGFGASAQRLTILLDASPSMAARTRDGRSRWQHAVERAGDLLQQSDAAGDVTVMDTAGRIHLSGLVDRESALAALSAMPPVAWTDVPAPPLPAGTVVHLFTDGVTPIEELKGAVVHSVFEPADNVGVTAFEVRVLPQDPTRVEALVQVVNASPVDQRARLLIRGEDDFTIAQDLDLPAGQTVDAAFDVSAFDGDVLGATVIAQSDALRLDDLAYAIVPRHGARRVLVVTPGNPDLIDALRNLPGVQLTVVAPDQYSEASGYNAALFDRFAPAAPPAAGALLLRPPARAWLAGETMQVADARVADWDPDHAVTGGVAWRNLRLERAAIETATGPSDALVLASGSATGALVTAGEARARWVKVGFALQDSNFRMQPDFPVFLGNALRWVMETVPVLTCATGSIEVALRDATVRDGGGRPVAASATARGVVFEASQPDVYTVSNARSRVLVVANLADPRHVLINHTHLGGKTDLGAMSRWLQSIELWVLLLVLAAALLLIEWDVYTRRARA